MNEKELMKLKPAEAEQFLKGKIREAVARFEEDKEKNDLQLGAAFYNLAKLYASLLNCNRLQIKPLQLDEKGQKCGRQRKCFSTTQFVVLLQTEKQERQFT